MFIGADGWLFRYAYAKQKKAINIYARTKVNIPI